MKIEITQNAVNLGITEEKIIVSVESGQGLQGPPGINSFGTMLTITGNHTLSIDDDDVVLADATAGNIIVDCPPVSDAEGYRFTVKKIDSTDHTVTLQAASGQVIDGSPEAVIYMENVSLRIASDGTAWRII